MWNTKHLALGATVFAVALVSFSNGDDNGKKKKYHIIHQKDGVLQEYDTLLPMGSTYSVEQFLADKGLDAANAQIVNMPAMNDGMVFMKDDGEAQIVMRTFNSDVMISDENGEIEEVKIIRKSDETGTEIIQKFVNGEEVTLSPEEKEALRINESTNGNHKVIVIEDDGEGIEWNAEGDHEMIELKVEVDDDGNTTVQKFVNGEEVEVSPEELEKIQLHKDAPEGQKMIFIEAGEDAEHAQEMELILESMNGNIDSLLQELEIEIETISGEGTEGQRIIIQEFHTEDATNEDGSDEIHKEIHFHSSVDVQGEEDFTLVLVTENVDETMETSNAARMIQGEMNDPISVYPNPNNGTFTITFNQEEKLKTAIEITDSQGKIVFKEKLGNFSGTYKKELDLKKNGTGVYLINVQQGDELSTLKVIVE